jgi:hypothetical protein
MMRYEVEGTKFIIDEYEAESPREAANKFRDAHDTTPDCVALVDSEDREVNFWFVMGVCEVTEDVVFADDECEIYGDGVIVLKEQE